MISFMDVGGLQVILEARPPPFGRITTSTSLPGRRLCSAYSS